MERAVTACRGTVIVILKLNRHADERFSVLIGHGSDQKALLGFNPSLALMPLSHQAERSTQHEKHEREHKEPFSLCFLHII